MLEKNKIQQENSISIRHGDDFSDIIAPVSLSNREFAYHFWSFKYSPNGAPFICGLYRNGIVEQLMKWGFYKRKRVANTFYFIKESENIIEIVEPHDMKDAILSYIRDNISELNFEYKGDKICIEKNKLLEMFLKQSHLIFNTTFLEQLLTHTKPILKDNKNEIYFFFANTIIKVTIKGIFPTDYKSILGNCIWKSHIKEFEFQLNTDFENCHFYRFIVNVSNNEQHRSLAFITAVGYLLHNYSHPSHGQAVIAYDEDISDIDDPMGGTGKGLFANAIKQLREVVKIDGKKFDTRDRFRFQDVAETTQIVWFDDVKPELGFDTFHSCLTDGWSIEKKFKDQIYICPEDSPKTYISSNSVLTADGTTNKRRQHIIEFSNHYSKNIINGNEEPIRDEHGCMFFDNDDWNALEWNMFYSFMINCALYYMQNGLRTYEYKSVNQNRLIKKTSNEFYQWICENTIEFEKEYDIKFLFDEFRKAYLGEDSDLKQRSFTIWLKEYCKVFGYVFHNRKSNGITYFKINKVIK